ncbi:putative ribonuclease H-like domain-containing protein [Tanacetum coccineum]
MDEDELVLNILGRPFGVCENLLVKVSKFIFPVDFVVLEMDEDELVLNILGWPFLATARAVIDVHEGKLSLRVESETVTFNIGKSMKSTHSYDDYIYCADHTAKMVQEQWVDLEKNQLPVVFSSALSIAEKSRLLEVVLKKGGMTVVKNKKDELTLTQYPISFKVLREMIEYSKFLETVTFTCTVYLMLPMLANTLEGLRNDVCIKESIGAGHSSEETGSSQDYILMSLWKYGSPFDSSSKDTSNDEPQPSNDAGKKDDEDGIDDQERTENISTDPLESIYADFFGDESELDLSNIATTYPVPTTPNTRIHKDHPLDHVLDDVQSGVQTRRMINEQGFINPEFPDKVYKVEKALYALHQAPRAWYPWKTSKPILKDAEAEDVDVHLYRSMIGSLMYLTTSRPDIMFVVCACARFQVTPKVSHLRVVKRIFRYLKGQPKLGLSYHKDSPFDLESYTDSDYAGVILDMKSTTEGCQFLGRRLISWQCKKQTIVASFTTEAEYVTTSSCCGQVLWIQNQMLDYGYNFMNTKIHIDNESTICIVKNLVFHSKTKHIEIRHHFIRDSNENKLI